MKGLLLGLAATAMLIGAPASAANNWGTSPSGATAAPRLYKNCTNFNKRYPHGVGKRRARDRTKSGDPVTNFLRSTVIYSRAISHNSDLDRDKDGVACEKK